MGQKAGLAGIEDSVSGDGDGEGRKLQCGKETSKTCPNDDDATACAPRRKMPH